MLGEATSNDQYQNNIIEAIKANDTTVLKKLYIENYPKVEAHILRNNGNKDQAKDIFQESMVALWRAIKKDRFTAKNPSAVQGYLYTIAKNKWTDCLRSSVYKKTVSSEFLMTDQAVNEEEEHIEYEQKLTQAKKAFEQLGSTCKELLSKFYFGKMSLNDIARLFNLDTASARNKKYRCMQKLRELVVYKICLLYTSPSPRD